MKKTKLKKIDSSFLTLPFLLLILCASFSLFYIETRQNNDEELGSEIKTPYPIQYSDNHITENAIKSDTKFKDSIFSRDNLLSNAISSVEKDPGQIVLGVKESGTWLWTPIPNITPKYRDNIISYAKKNGIKNIYLSIDSYLDIYIMPDGKEKNEKRKEFDDIVENFISIAKNSGITVDAEAGWRNWAEPGNTYKAIATLNYALKFNKDQIDKFRGFQYDVEPYLLDNYQKNKQEVLNNFLNLVNQTVSAMDKSNMILSIVVPEFYDGKDNDTPIFVYRGKNASTIEHLLSILDRRESSKIILMSYRNFAKGDDGSIDISRDEIKAGDSHQTKVVVAQETGNVNPPYVTFYNTSRKYYARQVANIAQTFSKESSYGGLSVHYINAFMDLK